MKLKFYIKIISLFLFFCVACSIEARASNRFVDFIYSASITNEIKEGYFSDLKIKVSSEEMGLTNLANQNFDVFPWTGLRENIDYIWSDESRQRLNGEVSLTRIVESLNKQDIFERKINDPEDQLSDIYKYRDLLAIPGLAGKMYWKIEKLFWRGQYLKAKEGFEFLTLSENKDGFTQGASRFFLGRMAKEIPLRTTGFSSRHDAQMTALDYLLSVHKFPTCLTYISFSYIMAAEVYSEIGKNKQAIALCMVDVPSIDWKEMNTTKHFNAAKYCLYLDDITNRVRHLYESYRYGNENTNEKIEDIINNDSFACSFLELCIGIPFSDYDKHLCFAAALEEKDDFPYEDKFYEAINHSWPEEKSLPDEIRNNRVLNNNILEHQK